MKWLLGLVAVWLVGDLGYSLFVRWSNRRWEAQVRRDASGVREGCADFSLGPDAADTAILLVHGINDSPACYNKMAPRLAKRGFYCRAMRLPGFALPTEQYAQATRRQWLEAIDREVKQLRRQRRRVCLAGHSLGGALTIRYLLDHPGAVDRCVLLAPAVDVANDRSPVLSTRSWHRVAKGLLLFTRVTYSPFGLDAVAVTDSEYPYRTPFTPRRMFDETYALIDANRGQAGQLTVPVLLAVSRKDRVIDWQAAVEYVERWQTSQKKVVYADPAGHALTIDQGWESLSDQIADWLDGDDGERREK